MAKRQAYKTVITVWSSKNLGKLDDLPSEISELTDYVERGLAYCSKKVTTHMDQTLVANDPDWDGGDFFEDED